MHSTSDTTVVTVKMPQTNIFQACTTSSYLFQPLEDLIGFVFIPKLLGRDISGGGENDLFSLPVQLGGLDLFIPTVTATRQHAMNWYKSVAIFLSISKAMI